MGSNEIWMTKKHAVKRKKNEELKECDNEMNVPEWRN